MIHALRFSTRTLLIIVVYFAAMLLALVTGAGFISDIIYSCTFAIMVFATFAALFRNDSRRVFWRGFCILGWLYLLLVYLPTSDGNFRDHLVTSSVLKGLQRVIAPIHAAKYVESGFQLKKLDEYRYQTGPNSGFDIFGGDSWRTTQRTGHSVWAILLGWIGGNLAVYLSKPRIARSANDRTESKVA